jgi:hypothetical protein
VQSFRKATKDIKEKFKNEDILSTIEKCKKAIISTMEILHSSLGITSTQILPSETALVPLFQYVYQREGKINELERKHMMKWFVVASFNGIYSSQTDSRLEDDLKIIKGAAENFPYNDLLVSMKKKIGKSEISEGDFKSIDFNILRGSAGKRYLFMLYILLHKNNANDWAGIPLHKKKFNELARHHIFPGDSLKEKYDETMRNHLGNLTFIDKNYNERLQNELPEDYLQEINESTLEAHFIPLDKQLWKMENYERFVNERVDLLWKKYCEIFKME